MMHSRHSSSRISSSSSSSRNSRSRSSRLVEPAAAATAVKLSLQPKPKSSLNDCITSNPISLLEAPSCPALGTCGNKTLCL